MIQSNPEKTRERIRLLEKYIREHLVADGSFVCRYFDVCRASRDKMSFYEGQLSHIGKHYDLSIDGRPMRIVIVGQEYGHGPAQVSLTARSEMIAGSAQAGFRGRNPHMKGTASLMRLLLGREPGNDSEGERLLDGHIYDGFALVNYLLCSAVRQKRDEFDGGASKGHSSPTMRHNCGNHFLTTLEILEPTMIVVQGKGVRQWLASVLSLPKKGPTAEIVQIAGEPVDLLTFDHPSAGGNSGWWGNSPKSRYLREIVTPCINKLMSQSGRQSILS